MPEELVTRAELARRLEVKPSTIRTWTSEKKIPAVRISAKVVRYNPAAVMEALQTLANGSAEENCNVPK